MKLSDETLLKYLGFNTQGDLGPWTFYTSKDKGLVWFIKSPPLQPPSFLQIHQRNLFRLAARIWRGFQVHDRNNWLDVAESARLTVTGYNIFVYVVITHDTDFLPAIERLAGLQLRRPF